ncbi:hypothetical protein NXS19_010001 [Fusarium pseudograminearum]|nr:hypothetical protein NXS19_010001 [Fusarium pseudograminearum]
MLTRFNNGHKSGCCRVLDPIVNANRSWLPQAQRVFPPKQISVEHGPLRTPHLPAIASAEGRGWPGWEVEGFDSRSRRLRWSPSREEADSIVGESIVFLSR